jgi:Ca2+-binding RTX toxin-like protein
MANIYGNWLSNKYDPFWGGGLQGTEDDDFIYGYEGNDDLFGDGGDDWLDGGTGADYMEGGDGNDDYIVDNTGDQVVEGGAFGNVADGNGSANSGYDTVKASINYVLPNAVEHLQLTGSAIQGEGNSLDNVISGTSGWNNLYGHGGDDELWGGNGDDWLYGGTGEDVLYGGQDRDRLFGGDQNDWLYGDAGNDTLYGDNGHDHLIGGFGADTMYGGALNDEYRVDDAGDVVVEYIGEGLDNVRSTVDYTLTANVEDLTLIGNAAIHGTGNILGNHITGNGANNTLNGGLGADFLRGEGGNDLFVFNTALGRGNVDVLTDFNTRDDAIVLENSIFTALPAENMRLLTAAEFRIGNAAMDTSDRIIYNWNSGEVLYDADGIGGEAAVHFASIGAGLNVTNGDFYII